MNSWLPDTASAPSDTDERRAGRRRGWRAGSGGGRSTARRRTAERRPRSRRCRGPRAYSDRTSCGRTEQKPPRSPDYCPGSSPRTSPTDSSPPLLQHREYDYKSWPGGRSIGFGWGGDCEARSAEVSGPKGQSGWWRPWGGAALQLPPPHQLGDLGERCKLSQWYPGQSRGRC